MKQLILATVLLLLPATVFAQHGTGSDWRVPIQLPDVGGDPHGAVGDNIAVDSAGTIYVFFKDKLTSGRQNMFLTKSSDGLSWSTPEAFAPAPTGLLGSIAVGSDDRLHVVWGQNVPVAAVYYANSADGGQSWSTPQLLSPTARFGFYSPQVTVDQRQRVHVAWHDGDPKGAGEVGETWYARSADNGGSWDTAQMLSSDDGRHSAFPRFTFSAAAGDTLAIGWRDEAAAGDWDILVAISTDGGVNWSTTVGAGGSGDQWDPVTLVDPNGTIHLGIMEYPRGVNSAGSVTIKYSQSQDAGQSWSTPVSMVTKRSRFPHLQYDTTNDVLWFFTKDERDYVNPRTIYADLIASYSTDGGATWSALEFVTDEGDNEVALQGYAVDSHGGVHINYNRVDELTDAWTLHYTTRSSPVLGGTVVGTTPTTNTGSSSSSGTTGTSSASTASSGSASGSASGSCQFSGNTAAPGGALWLFALILGLLVARRGSA